MVMKKNVTYFSTALLTLAQILLVVTAIAAPAQGQTPVGWWKLDDGSGTEAVDWSGNGHTASLVNGVSWVTGKFGDAVSANAADSQYVSIPAIDLSDTQSVTVALWANRTYSTAGGHALFEATTDHTNSSTGFGFFPDDATCNGIQAALRGNVGYTANCYSQPSSGVWHHLAVVLDKSQTGGDQVAFYVDGVLQTPTRSLYASTNTNNFGNNPIYLFSRGGSTEFSSGMIDDLRLYNSALTAAQIQQIYTAPDALQLSSPLAPGQGCPGGTAGCVQVNSASTQKSQTTSVTLTNNVVSGNTLAVGIRWQSSKVTLSSLSVSGGCAVSGGFVLPTPSNSSNPSKYSSVSTAAIAYGTITTGGPCTISSQLSSSVSAQYLTVHELNVGAYECSSMNHQDWPGTKTNAVTSLSCATTKNGDYLLGEYFDMGANGGTWTAGTGFALETKSGAEGSQTEDMVQSVAGSVAATFTTSVIWAHPTTALMAFQPAVSPNFTISASPSSLSVAQGNQGTSTITTAVSGGFSSAIALSASGVPSGTTVSFNPQTIPAPGSGNSTMTITVGASTPVGTYPITVTGNGGGIQQNATVTLTVTAPPNFTLSASPSSLTVVQGNQGTSTITTTVSGGFSSAIALSASGVPTGTTVSFNPQTIPAPGSGNSTMTITVGASTPVGTYPITVTGNGGGIQQNATVTLTVTAPPNFTLSASPSSLSVAQGNQGTSTITTTVSWGFSSAIALSASGVPTGTTVSFNPQTIPAPGSGNSTMTITVGASTPMGTYPITVTGNGGGSPAKRDVTLTVSSGSITLDGNVHGVHDNGLSASTTASVSIGTPTAGDLITCEVSFGGGTLVSVADNQNGTYAAAIPVHLNTTLSQWFGIYYQQNVAGSPTTVTLTTSESLAYSAISCQAWKGVAVSNPLDSTFGQLQDAVATPNPTTGANKTPAANGELVIASVGLHTAGTPTPDTSYTLIDGAPVTQWWPEYWVQTTATATAGNYTWPSDDFTNMMAAFRPSNFTISASPSSLSVVQGNQGTSTITTTVSGGFSSAIALSASGVPTGTTVSFNPQTIPAPGSGNSTMTITVGASTPLGTYPITVTGNGGGIQQNATVTLTVTAPPNFTISASPSSLSVVQGNQGTSTITTTVSGGFSSAIALSASGVPTGTTVSFNPQTIPAPGSGNSTMTITVGASTPLGTYPITVTGNGGGIQQNATVTLTVTVPPNFTISASPASLSVVQGNQGTSTITTTVSGGFSSAIALSASGVPTGTTVSFNPQTIPAPGSGNSTMTITVGASTPLGTYPITVTGNGGGIQQNATVTLTVTAPPNFTLSASPASLSVVQGNQGTSTITTTVSGGFQQCDRSVGLGRAFRHHRELQPADHSRPGFRKLDHDHHGGGEHAAGNLSHHRDR